MKRNIIGDYLSALEGAFNFEQTREFTAHAGGYFDTYIPNLCAEILELRKHEKFRRVFYRASEALFGPLAVLTLIAIVASWSYLQEFYGKDYEFVSTVSPAVICMGTLWLIAIRISSLGKKNERLNELCDKLDNIIGVIKEVRPLVSGKKGFLSTIAEETLNDLALKIVTMEKAMPQGQPSYYSSDHGDANRRIRQVALIFEKAGAIEGQLDPYFKWAKQEWQKLATQGVVGIDYTI